ncbi:MAG: HAD hydrolase family protein [Candidatus Helarchaeota archaeon]
MIQVCAWDLEGPLSMTDFAAELFKYLEKKQVFNKKFNLGELFYLISNYDDYLIDYPENQKKLGIGRYDPGDTLRLLAPFYVKFFSNTELFEIAKNKLGIIPGAIDTISNLKKSWDIYIISTSYSQFAHQVAEKLGISKDHVYCTKLDIDELSSFAENLSHKIETLVNEIFPKYLKNEKDINSVIDDLNEFFWNDKNSSYYKIMEKIVVRGGKQKELAIEDISNRTGMPIRSMIAIGDSITDINMLGRLNRENGIAISFNGNNYSISAANIAITTPNVFGVLPIFYNKDRVWDFVAEWNENYNDFKNSIEKIPDDLLPDFIIEYFKQHKFVPRIDDLRNLTEEQKLEIIKFQKSMRKKVRGWVGELG